MFRVRPNKSDTFLRISIGWLLGFNLLVLVLATWVTVSVYRREQWIVGELVVKLSPELRSHGASLVDELYGQLLLSVVLIAVLLGTAFMVAIIWQAYRSSQASLRDVKALAADILSSIDQAVITTNLDGIVTGINLRGMELLEATEGCVGQPLTTLTNKLPLDEFRQEADADRSVRLTRDFTVIQDGSRQVLRAYCQPLQNYEEEDIGNVIQLQDVTERIWIQERVLRMERFMGLGSLAAGLHHELKNPLAALSLHVQLLEEQLQQEQMSFDSQEMLGVIQSEVWRAGEVLESFRNFASTDQLNVTPANIVELCEQQVSLVAPKTSAARIIVSIESSLEDLKVINVDKVRISQVLLNLIINAIEAMPDGGYLTIKLSEQAHPEAVVVEVIDTGIGISVGLRDQVFDPYFTTKSSGSGLGLALSDKIIRQHGGELTFLTLNQGTLFRFTLPKDPIPDHLSGEPYER